MRPDPPPPRPGEVTAALASWREGDPEAAQRLFALVYPELHRLAEGAMRRERGAHTLQPTAVVHEAYLRMNDHDRIDWQDRSHFFGVAARAMRHLLVDHARRRESLKRGGGATRVELAEGAAAAGPRAVDVLDLDRALARLEAADARQARVVELRFFGGLSVEETADAMAMSPVWVKRTFRSARAFLARELLA
jgi:RNA polymerase sigma factor (TIGR02999 family)